MPVPKPARPGLPPAPDETAPATLSEQSAQWFRAHQNPILVGVSLFVLIGSLFTWMHARAKSRAQSAWDDLATARSTDDIRRVVDAYEDTDAAPFLHLRLAGALEQDGKLDQAYVEYKKAGERMNGPVFQGILQATQSDAERSLKSRQQEVPKLLEEMKKNHLDHLLPGEAGGPAGPALPPTGAPDSSTGANPNPEKKEPAPAAGPTTPAAAPDKKEPAPPAPK